MSYRFERFGAHWQLPAPPPAGEPIFILAAGWRCGSTLLQRLICGSGEVLVWGEPYGRAGLLPAMTRSALALGDDWPLAGAVAPQVLPTDLGRHWIANLYPEPQALRDAFRAQLDTLLALPAQRRGFSRFGVKEVRLHGVDAAFLRWIYPDARFFFLVRDPWAAWSSAKGAQWLLRWPEQKVADARAFAHLWRRLAESFLQWPDDSGLLLRLEDLVQPDFDLRILARHGRLASVDGELRQLRIRGMQKPPIPLDAAEIETITQLTGRLAQRLGYTPPQAP